LGFSKQSLAGSVAFKKTAMDEIVTFDARELQREFIRAGRGDVVWILQQVARAAFPG